MKEQKISNKSFERNAKRFLNNAINTIDTFYPNEHLEERFHSEIIYNTKLMVAYLDINNMPARIWTDCEWEIVEEPTNEYQPKEGDIVIAVDDCHALSIGKYSYKNIDQHIIEDLSEGADSHFYDRVFPYSVTKLHSLMKEYLGYEDDSIELTSNATIIKDGGELTTTDNQLIDMIKNDEVELPKLTAKTRDGVKVEVDENVFFTSDTGYLHYVPYKSIDNKELVFHSIKKAQLFAEGVKGKILQVNINTDKDENWYDCHYNLVDWRCDISTIRVKPDEVVKQYKPFDTCNFDLFDKVIKSKDGNIITRIIAVNKCAEYDYYYQSTPSFINNEELFKYWTFEDGSVIGQEVIN